MGYNIKYSILFRIHPGHFRKALQIFNQLHTDEMLLAHAHGQCWPKTDLSVKESHWYSWVSNPTSPYRTLKEAFDNWRIVEENVTYLIDPETHEFIVSGDYNNKWGQQNFLIEQLAPVLNDVCIHVIGEDNKHYMWNVVNHHFETVRWQGLKNDYCDDADDDDDDDVKTNKVEIFVDTPENLSLTGI